MDNTSSSKNLKRKRKRKQKQRPSLKCQGLLSVVFSWSLSDVLNKHLYKFQVEQLPLTFSSTTHYMNSFITPLLEETHADLLSQLAGISHAPVSFISGLRRVGEPEEWLYSMNLTRMSYTPKTGDLIALTKDKPRSTDDLDRPYSPFLIALVKRVVNKRPAMLVILSSKLLDSHPIYANKQSDAFIVYLTNLTTNMRIRQALKSSGNMKVIQRTLAYDPLDARNCDQCCSEGENVVIDSDIRKAFDSFKLNTSQEAAVLTCLAANKCLHKTCTKLIWGPPGTGKTKTLASLLFVLLRTKHRTLTCAPTNIAVVGVVKRLVSLVRDHDYLGCGTYGFGDIILIGNEGRMEINANHRDLHDVFLDFRIDALLDCLSLWKICLGNMIGYLGCLVKRCSIVGEESTSNKKFNFRSIREKLITCIRSLYTHLPTSVLSLDYAKKMYCSIDLLQKVDESQMEMVTECLQALKDLQAASCIPNPMKRTELENLCLRNACLIFSTASSSIKLFRDKMTPIELVLIDEAAQLKECESVIPLKLRGVRNAVLVGDERQLPSTVQSKICEESKFGRSLFERLVLLGHEKHLLNVQYRMQPNISRFPNIEFYDGKIVDGPNVIDTAHEKHFLKGSMYGSYAFINVDSVNEEHDNYNSTKNMLEVAVIAEIVANLFQESVMKKQKVTVGCISPYKAQVDAIEEELGNKYNPEMNGSYFSVKVRSVDGFQGSEEDVIIFSTVRCNEHGSVGFLWSRERTNVALTRAKHCLWIIGNKETMIKSGSVWNTLVFDAEIRGCVYNASDDKNLANAMVHTMVELGKFSSLLKSDSILFKELKWKVTFTNTFCERLTSIANINVCKLVLSLIVKLSSGWREVRDNSASNLFSKRELLNLFQTYCVDGQLYLVWSVDLMYDKSFCIQVLHFWDILPLSQIQQCALHLERVLGNYTLDEINRCEVKRFERNQVLPISWSVDVEHDWTLWRI